MYIYEMNNEIREGLIFERFMKVEVWMSP